MIIKTNVARPMWMGFFNLERKQTVKSKGNIRHIRKRSNLKKAAASPPPVNIFTAAFQIENLPNGMVRPNQLQISLTNNQFPALLLKDNKTPSIVGIKLMCNILGDCIQEMSARAGKEAGKIREGVVSKLQVNYCTCDSPCTGQGGSFCFACGKVIMNWPGGLKTS